MEVLRGILKNRLAIFVVVLMCVLGFLANHVAKANATFTHAYLVYAAAADDADTAAYAPTATNNLARQEVNLLLVQVLQNQMTDAERLQKAQRGLELLKVSQSQIDAMTPKIEASQQAIDAMEKSVVPGDAIFQRGDPQKIITLAKDRVAATSDIRALSYRAVADTIRIFQHIVDVGGTLSNAYVNQLNNSLPSIEEGFNTRQNRYSDMQYDFDQIQAAYKDFKSATAKIQ